MKLENPEFEPLPPLPPTSRLAMMKSLGILALAVIGAAGIGGTIGLGVHWANEAAQAPSIPTASPIKANPQDSGPPGVIDEGKEVNVGPGPGEMLLPDVGIFPSALPWFVPGSSLSAESDRVTYPVFIYEMSDSEVKDRLKDIADYFGISSQFIDDGYGGFTSNPEAKDGWLSGTSEGAGAWSFSRPFGGSSVDCEILPPAPEPKPTSRADDTVPEPAPLPASDSPVFPQEGAPGVSDESPPYYGGGTLACGPEDVDVGAPLTEPEAREVLSGAMAPLGIPANVEWEFMRPYGNTLSVTLHEQVAGERSGMKWFFDIDENGEIFSASGHLAEPRLVGELPIIQAVDAINRSTRQPWVGLIEALYGDIAVSPMAEEECQQGQCSEYSTPSSPESSTRQSGAASTLPLAVQRIEITGAALKIRQYSVNGDWALVPVWILSSPDTELQWSVPALADSAYDLSD